MVAAIAGSLALVGLWYRRRRKEASPAAASDAPAPSAPLKVYSVEQVVGKTGTPYAQQLQMTLQQLQAALGEPKPLSLPTAPPDTDAAADAAAEQPEQPATAVSESAEAAPCPADAPTADAPTADTGSAEAAEAAAAPAAPAQPAAAQPAAGGSGDQQIQEFSQQVSAPPELRLAPAKRFSSRKAAVNPAALAQVQKSRTTMFVETDTGQHIPLLQQQMA
ncbi:hypothetical protein [Hymenobacter endophyticus]|uniref:LPXTG cell wall anchor domain-containing protein n=1 Tax=Hymenobacter endophyticus TaxID=3076335 RepID=A0ABU3TL38_9BACT|nr:hypothetical protein [Hymenobacter endophyticus]MDU0372085.1 hypothetical protein [Hymenobacter endophyticus]